MSQKLIEGSGRGPFQETMLEFVWKDRVKQSKTSFGLFMLIDVRIPHSRKESSNCFQHHYYYHHCVINYNHSRANTSAFRNFSLGYHSHKTKHVRIPLGVLLGTAISSAYCQDDGLMGYYLVGRFEVFKPVSQRNNIRWKPQISQFLLLSFNVIRRQRRVCLYIRTVTK